MPFVLEMRSTADWNDVRYRAYTTSARKAQSFKSVPKIRFTDSGHGLVPHVAEHWGKREPAINVLADHVRQAMGKVTLSDGPTTHREWADHYRLLCAEMLEVITACAAILPRYHMAGKTTGEDEELSAVLERVQEAITKAAHQ